MKYATRRYVAVTALVLAAMCAGVAITASARAADGQGGVVDRVFARIADGEISSARDLLSKDDNDPVARTLRGYIDSYRQVDDLRVSRRQANYEADVAEAREYMAKKDWEEALTASRRAFDKSFDKDEFRKLGWVSELVEQVTDLAEQYRREEKWLDAGAIYSQLSVIFEDIKKYEQLTRTCAQHAHLEAVYVNDKEWESTLDHITWLTVSDALYSINRFYVNDDVDFRAISKAGIDAIRILLNTTKLAETFDQMSNEQARKAYLSRLDAIAEDMASTSGTFTLQDARTVFINVITANTETIRLPEPLVIREYMDAALTELDPFTTVIWPAEKAEFQKAIRGQFSGVGIEIMMKDTELTVVRPLAGTPADRAGIGADDVIVKVDGKPTAGISISRAVSMITGPRGTPVTLSIRPAGESELREVTIIRDTIVIHTVRGYERDDAGEWIYWIDDKEKIGYIQVTGFSETTMEDFDAALSELMQHGMRGLIIDLRFNLGGLLRTATEMVDRFVSSGTIVSTRSEISEPWSKSANPQTAAADVPLIVLINEASASASEIVAGALQDLGRAFLIGSRTYGKGTVQQPFPVADDTAWLKLTTSKYYLPSDRSIHREEDSKVWGVEPDLKLDLTIRENRGVVKMHREADIDRPLDDDELYLSPEENEDLPRDGDSDSDGGDTEATTQPATSPASRPVYDDPPIDPQRDLAVLVMRAKLLTGQPWPGDGKGPMVAKQK